MERPIETVRPSTYADAAAAYLEAGFSPIPVHQKNFIPTGCTGRRGTVTAAKVAAWTVDPEWMGAGVALRLDAGTVAIDVDEYDGKHGADQLAELEAKLGSLPATPSNTSRGKDSPSRQFFFLLPEEATLAAKAAPDIDVLQYGHRYAVVSPAIHATTQQPYQWYDADGEPMAGIPNPGDFELLPQAWFDHLRTIAEPIEYAGFDGAVEEWLETVVDGRPSTRMLALIESIPSEDFGHDEMLHLSFRLVRLGAEREPGAAQAVALLYREWLRGTYDTPENRSDLDKALAGAIRKAGRVEAELPSLLPAVEAMGELPEFSAQGTEFLSLIASTADDDEGWVQARRLIIREVLDAGLDAQHALTIAWNSPSGQRLHSDLDGLRMLWREVEYVGSGGPPSTAPTADADQPLAPVTPIRSLAAKDSLLTIAERDYLAEQGAWWGSHYLSWVGTVLPMSNDPYHNMNRWTVLSVITSEQGHFRTNGRRVNLGLFQVILGGSTSGKSESFMLSERITDAYFPRDDTPDIGDLKHMSPSGLQKALLKRDGRPALTHSDEVQSLFKQIKDNKWQDSLLGNMADYYEGKVRAKQTMGDSELSGKSGTTFLTAHLMGVESKLLEQLDIGNWESGFLLRCVFAIGDPAELDDDFFEETQDDDDEVAFDAVPKQWAAEFAHMRQVNETMGAWRAVSADADALARLSTLTRRINDMVSGHARYEDVLRGGLKRFVRSIRKCATMIALSEAERTVTLRHVLIAIEQGEEWLTAMIKVLDRTAESQLMRDVNAVEKMASRKAGAELREADVFAEFRPQEYAERILRQLVAEDRATREVHNKTGAKILRLSAKAVAA